MHLRYAVSRCWHAPDSGHTSTKLRLTENSALASESDSPSSKSVGLFAIFAMDFLFRLVAIVQSRTAFVFATHDLPHLLKRRRIVSVGRCTHRSTYMCICTWVRLLQNSLNAWKVTDSPRQIQRRQRYIWGLPFKVAAYFKSYNYSCECRVCSLPCL